MLTRRFLLQGAGTALLLGGCSARAVALPPSNSGGTAGAPLVKPSTAWTGVGLSGGTPPSTANSRSPAAPAIQWQQPPEQRLAANTVIGVQARALGGVAYVDFWVEGTTQRVNRSIYHFTDPNGKTYDLDGFWITLDVAGAAAMHLGGEVRVFATATANDGTMATRTIGGSNPNTSGNGNGDYEMRFYVHTDEHDKFYTIAASNNDVSPNFTTIKKAMDQAALDGALAPEFKFTQDGFYELENRAGHYSGGKGYARFVAAPNITATLRRALPPGPDRYSQWQWYNGYDKMEFRGERIILDFRNWQCPDAGSSTVHWANGCRITNSAPPAAGRTSPRDSADWFKGPRPPELGSFYFTDCHIEYVNQPVTYRRLVARNMIKECYGIMYTAVHFASGNSAVDCTADFYRGANGLGTPAVRLAYSGSASSVTVAAGGGPDNIGAMTITVDGAAHNFSLGAYPGDANFLLTDLKAAVEASVPGVSLTILDNTFKAAAMGGSGNLKAGNVVLSSSWDMHTDFWQAHCYDGTVRTNAIIENNAQLGTATEGFQLYFLDSPCADIVFANNISNVGSSSWGHNVLLSHIVIEHASGGTMRWDPQGNGMGSFLTDKYCAMLNCVITDVSLQNGATGYPTYPAMINCAISGAQPNNAASSGNIALSSTEMAGAFQNPLLNNFLPAGALLTTRAPSVDAPLDNRGNPRGTANAIGALAAGVSQPTYLF